MTNDNEWKGQAIEAVVQQIGKGIDANTAEKFIKLIISSPK